MRVGHDEGVAADTRRAYTFQSSAVDGDVFANNVAVADFQPRGLAAVGDVLRIAADYGKGKNLVVGAEARRSTQNNVGDQPAVLAQLDARTDDGIGTNFARRGNFCRWIHHGRRMDIHGRSYDSCAPAEVSGFVTRRSSRRQLMTASQATLSPKYALPNMRPALPRQTSTSTSMRSWSPGITGLRNLARSIPVNSSSLCSRSGNSMSSSTPPACAIASTTSTPGMMGPAGKCPTKYGSLTVTFLIATIRLVRTISVTRSISKKG